MTRHQVGNSETSSTSESAEEYEGSSREVRREYERSKVSLFPLARHTITSTQHKNNEGKKNLERKQTSYKIRYSDHSLTAIVLNQFNLTISTQ